MSDWQPFEPQDDEFLDALALELCLEPKSAERLAAEEYGPAQLVSLQALLADSDFQTRVKTMRVWVQSTRAELEHWEDTSDARDLALDIVGQVRGEEKRRTALADLPEGWRGDWSLIRGFLRTRWRSSLVVRLAAASLIAHMIAVPTLAAYILWKKPQPLELSWSIEPPWQEEQGEETPAPEWPEVDDDLWSALGLQGDNALAIARHTFSVAGPAPSWLQEDPNLRAFWQARVQAWNLEQAYPLVLPSTSILRSAPCLGHVLALEALLDGFALRPTSAPVVEALAPERWALWLHPVSSLSTESVSTEDPGALALGDLARHALLRAHTYGLAELPSDWDTVWPDFQERHPALARAVRPLSPLGPDWLALLRRASGASGQGAAPGEGRDTPGSAGNSIFDPWAGQGERWREAWPR